MEIHRKYQERGVVFVGVTDTHQAAAQAIVDESRITWPLGYHAGPTIHALINGARVPALFVIGADGRVAWNDGVARYRHSLEFLEGELENAIEEALKAAGQQD